MPYPVDHDTRNRLSAIPMIASPLQSKRGGLELAFSPKSVAGGRTECGQTGWESVSGGAKRGHHIYQPFERRRRPESGAQLDIHSSCVPFSAPQ